MEAAYNIDNNNFSLFSCFNPYQSLEARISAIALTKIDQFTDNHIADLTQGFKLSSSFSFFAGSMKRILAKLPLETIRSLLFTLMATKSQGEIDAAFQSILNVLDENAQLELSDMKSSKMANLTFKSYGITKIEALKNGYEREGIAIWKEFVVEARYFFHQLLDILINLTGINELTKHRKKSSGGRDGGSDSSNFAAQAKLDRYWKLLALPATLFGVIYSSVQLTVPAFALTSMTIVAFLTSLVAYNRYWKPCPIDCPGLKTLSVDLLRSKDPIYPRMDILSRIDAAFRAKKGVILVGKPGAGKTQIAHSLVHQMAAGTICPFIKDFQFFKCNAANLTNIESAPLSSIEDRFKYHEHQAVFFFDEIHALFRKKPDDKAKEGISSAPELAFKDVGTELKGFCETFPYVIGATTEKEYEEYVKNQPAISDRRFEVIFVHEMDKTKKKDFKDMKNALSQHLKYTQPNITRGPQVIEYIIENAHRYNPKTCCIDAAMSLLNSAIQTMIFDSDRTLEDKIITLKNKLGILSQNLEDGNLNESDLEKEIEKYEAIESELKIEEQNLEKKRLKTKKMQDMENRRLQLKKQASQMANRHTDLANKPTLAKEWYKLQAHIKTIEDFIAKERKALSFAQALNSDLIEKIILEKEKSRKIDPIIV